MLSSLSVSPHRERDWALKVRSEGTDPLSGSHSKMIYRRIERSDLPPEDKLVISQAFEEVCRLLRLSPREDDLRDAVADIVIDCAKRGVTDSREMLHCAEEALRRTN
jgi:hypothetical protein